MTRWMLGNVCEAVRVGKEQEEVHEKKKKKKSAAWSKNKAVKLQRQDKKKLSLLPAFQGQKAQ